MACSSCAARAGGSYRPQVIQGPVADLPDPDCEPDPDLWKEYHRRLTCLKTNGKASQLNTSVAHLNSYLGMVQTVQNSPSPCKYIHNLIHVENLIQLANERGIYC